MIKRFFALILVLALAISCVALADSNIEARSATIKVTVNCYKIRDEQLAKVGKTSEDIILATYNVDYNCGQATGTSWTIEQSLDDGKTWTPISFSSDIDTKAVVNVSDINYDGYAAKVKIKATATITSPGYPKGKDTESVILDFVVVNDKQEEDPGEWKPDDDDPGKNDNDETDEGGEDTEDERSLEGLLSIGIGASKYEAMDGDSIQVDATPIVGEQLKTALGLGIGDVRMKLYMKTNQGVTTIEKTGTGTISITFTANYIKEVNNIYKFWAVGELTLAPNVQE